VKVIGVRTIHVSDVVVPERLRVADPTHVDFLKSLMVRDGFINPIEVAERPGEKFRLVDGLHRLTAVIELGAPTLEAQVIKATDDECALREAISELSHRELGALDRAVFLHAGKQAYEKLHPETKAGAAGGYAKAGSANEIISFAEIAADQMGLGKRAVQRAIRIGEAIPTDLRRRIAGTRLADREVDLYELTKHDPDRQRDIVTRMTAGDKPAKSVSAAIKIIDGHTEADADTASLYKLLDLFARAPKRVKRSFLGQLKDEGVVTGFDLDGGAE
jgi:ParB family chromosome partitioning protein